MPWLDASDFKHIKQTDDARDTLDVKHTTPSEKQNTPHDPTQVSGRLDTRSNNNHLPINQDPTSNQTTSILHGSEKQNTPRDHTRISGKLDTGYNNHLSINQGQTSVETKSVFQRSPNNHHHSHQQSDIPISHGSPDHQQNSPSMLPTVDTSGVRRSLAV